jgi:hypothetical protein
MSHTEEADELMRRLRAECFWLMIRARNPDHAALFARILETLAALSGESAPVPGLSKELEWLVLRIPRCGRVN